MMGNKKYKCKQCQSEEIFTLESEESENKLDIYCNICGELIEQTDDYKKKLLAVKQEMAKVWGDKIEGLDFSSNEWNLYGNSTLYRKLNNKND